MISLPVFGVEIAGGLVGQHDGRVVHQRARNRHALPLAAGKLVGLVSHARLQTHRCQRILGALDALLRGHAA